MNGQTCSEYVDGFISISSHFLGISVLVKEGVGYVACFNSDRAI